MAERLRRRCLPTRILGDTVIVARPLDGAPIEIASTAAFVWRHLDGWTTPAEIDQLLAATFPEVVEGDRRDARTTILKLLQDEDLVERR